MSAILQSADGILTAIGHDNGAHVPHSELVEESVVDTIVDAAQTIMLCAQHQKRIVDDILTLVSAPYKAGMIV